MGAAVSSSHVVSAAPSCSGGGLLTLFPCSSVGSLSWETDVHKILQRESFPRAAALHKLLWCGVPSMGCSPLGIGCSSVGPHGVRSHARKTCFSMGSRSMGPQVLAEACSRVGSPWGHSLLQASTCSSVGSSLGCKWISAPPWTPMGCRGKV